VVGGAVMSVPLVAACFEFDFMGGSMGSVVGERFVRGVKPPSSRRCPSSASPPPAARACRKAC
jgi:acetyl-CoA carboxylase carboxyl transferase subunit beta